MQFRPTRAEINLAALQANLQQVKAKIPKTCGVIAMVKADAYGHGAVPVAKTIEKSGISAFGVATVEEGVELREAGIKTKILILQGLLGQGEAAAKVLLEHQLTPVIHSVGTLQLWNTLSKNSRQPLAVHLKIDTGMTRLGVTLQTLPSILNAFQQSKQVKLEGVLTHLAWQKDQKYTRDQTQLFQEMGEQIQKTLGKIPIWHVANSAAVMSGEPIEFPWTGPPRLAGEAGQSWVRPGIMLYGIPPYPDYASKIPLQPVMSLVSQIALIKNVPAKTKVSYNCTFETKRPSRIGVIPIGYADGYPLSASNRAEILVEGKRAPVIGRVTMDMIMADLTDLPEAHVGSEVVLLGKQGKDAISADQLAGWGETIPYEIVCRVSKRMPRVYTNG